MRVLLLSISTGADTVEPLFVTGSLAAAVIFIAEVEVEVEVDVNRSLCLLSRLILERLNRLFFRGVCFKLPSK